MATTIKQNLNRAQPNTYPSNGQVALMGDLVLGGRMSVAGDVASDVLELSQGARAVAVVAAYAMVGTATGQLTPVIAGATPAAGEVGLTADGNILFAAADAVTSAQVVYLAVDGKEFSDEVSIAAGAGSFQQQRQGVLLLEVKVDGAQRTIINRGGAPAAGEVCLSDDGQLTFNAADDGLKAEVRYLAQQGVGFGTDADAPTRLTTLQEDLF